MPAWNPTQFITDQATKLYKLCLESTAEVAVEMIELNLRQSYQQGINAGRSQGFREAQTLAKASIERLKKIASS